MTAQPDADRRPFASELRIIGGNSQISSLIEDTDLFPQDESARWKYNNKIKLSNLNKIDSYKRLTLIEQERNRLLTV